MINYSVSQENNERIVVSLLRKAFFSSESIHYIPNVKITTNISKIPFYNIRANINLNKVIDKLKQIISKLKSYKVPFELLGLQKYSNIIL